MRLKSVSYLAILLLIGIGPVIGAEPSQWSVEQVKIVNNYAVAKASINTADKASLEKVWKPWLRDGVTHGGSLYLWLESDRLKRLGAYDDAYTVAVSAWLATLVEINRCHGLSRKRENDFVAHLIGSDNALRLPNISSEVKRKAIIMAVGREQVRIDKGRRGNMACWMAQINGGFEPRLTEMSDKKRNEQDALDAFKDEHRFDALLKEENIQEDINVTQGYNQ